MERKMIEKVIVYIEEHLDTPLSLDEIAKAAGFSKFHLNRMFARQEGCTMYKYIQTRRLEEAADDLASTNKPIIEIAYEAQYSSQQAFTLAFNQQYGCPPQQYRTIKSPAKVLHFTKTFMGIEVLAA